MTTRRLLACALALATLPLVAPAATAARPCTDPHAPLTVEEQRLAGGVPREILRRSGFDAVETSFRRGLCATSGLREAHELVRARGRALWELAVARARGTVPPGDLPVEDDRPLYWARLALTRMLAQWDPSFPVNEPQRDTLRWELERASRGQTSLHLAPSHGLKRVLVSGFDPFELDEDIRRSNPSGAAALALDGRTVATPTGPARVEATMFPVRWESFERGMVERTFRPHVMPGAGQVDMFATVSQGRPGRFDIEHWNGRWHQGEDNNNETRRGVIEVPGPHPVDPPEFVPTTQPYADIVRADTGRFPAYHNPRVTEIPRGESEPVERPDGPTPGSTARAGSGGNYLSNEIAYRTTLLRDTVGARMRGGHVHTPVLTFAPGNREHLTDPAFEDDLRDIVAQVVAIVRVAAGTRGAEPPIDIPRSPRDADGHLPEPAN